MMPDFGEGFRDEAGSNPSAATSADRRERTGIENRHADRRSLISWGSCGETNDTKHDINRYAAPHTPVYAGAGSSGEASAVRCELKHNGLLR